MKIIVLATGRGIAIHGRRLDGIEGETSQEIARQMGINHEPAVDVLNPYSTLVRLGARVVEGVVGNPLIPRVTTSATAGWLTETGTSTSSDLVLAQIAAAPKKIARDTTVDKQRLLQSQIAEPMIANDLLDVIGRGIDREARPARRSAR